MEVHYLFCLAVVSLTLDLCLLDLVPLPLPFLFKNLQQPIRQFNNYLLLTFVDFYSCILVDRNEGFLAFVVDTAK